MVETVEENTQELDEFQQILRHIENKDNFLLSGGAGSGKTFTLVQVIKKVIEEYPTSKVACMTYTNAAVKEIEERVNHKNLNVTTIHDFLWDNIKHFQKELKKGLVDLANDDEITRIKISDTEVPTDYFKDLEKGIQYKEYLRLVEGIISHDELLILANHMFKTYPKLSDILKDKFKFIFVDEYQDTNELVIKIFLEYFKLSNKSNVVGFFGDSMQSIYDDGIGGLDGYKGEEEGRVKEVKKEQNRRNPKLIIDLANRLRTDGLEQTESNDKNAPNIDEKGVLKTGDIQFLYSDNENIYKVKGYLGWDFNDSKNTKELNLTHNLIADKAGIRNLMNIYNNDGILKYKNKVRKYIKDNGIDQDFSAMTFGEVSDFLEGVNPTNSMQQFINDNPELYNVARNQNWEVFSKIYVDKDQLLDDKKQSEDDENKKGSKRDALIKHLYKIETNIFLYSNKRYNEFLRATDYRFSIKRIEDKRTLKASIESLINVEEKTIEEVINEANENGICLIDDKLERFMVDKEYLFNRVKEVKYKEFQKLFIYLEGLTPFSTQHKTKGAEFDNVLVILDNGGWNKYNFKNLFLGSGTESVLKRTQKLFYVCCTRSKEKLAIYFNSPSNAVIDKAKEWFGTENVIDLDSVS
ncbi:DNA helicase-2/ATP-dependent DNA helicase PcrA [Tenacibaculum gallaicum]|uniref:DNA helicase-2/ATP-dependent DNA helicase PcrA n=1 Tax=Tenacibaculum gallaicum TaxID=561505 RepID=A0A3E0I7U7_9FLAO|nr:UvrD-helicase domain-containing protein [Tenacibaculum gallaicum]REH54730.1 DNA helicase-2/ATP-dependent DNA helicase PcrA [Tenacibaculum gallaicum]